MSSETDAEFVERASRTPCGKWPLIDHDRLFALARRGAASAARIEALEAALREIAEGEVADHPLELRAFCRATLGTKPSGEQEHE